MQGPGSLGVVSEITVVSGAPGTGVFIYKAAPARGTLIAAAVGTGGTDPTGRNTVSPVLAVGVWSAVTGLPGAQSMVDAFGNLTVQGTDGNARLKIWTGADGIAGHNAGAVWWLNDFGAVLQVIDPVVLGTFQYQDKGSAVQGQVIGAQVSSTSNVVDPINGFTLNPGVTIIDPVFGDNLNIVGDVIRISQLGFTRNAFVSSQDASGATTAPYLVVEAPEHTTTKHATTYIMGATEDGTTRPAKVIYSIVTGNAPAPTVNTNNYLEIQPQSGQGAIEAFMQTTADHGFDTRVTGDTADRVSIDNTPRIAFGPGNAALDTILSRISGATFGITSNLNINNGKTGNVLSVGTGPSDFAGTVYIEDSSAPATPGTASALYSSSGNLLYVSEDGNKYDTGVLHVDLPSTSITAVNTAFTNVGSTIPVAARKYKIHVRFSLIGAPATAVPRFQITTPAISSQQETTVLIITSAGISSAGTGASGIGPFAGPTMATGVTQVWDLWAECTFSASGNLQCQANTSVSGDSWTFAPSTLELYPVT